MSSNSEPHRGEMTVLSADCALEGTLRLRGDVRIEGAVYGNITTDADMWVGPSAHVLGEVRAANVSIAGVVDGIVRAREFLLVHSTGRVRGHMRYEELAIERGGLVDGTSTWESDIPKSMSDDDDDDAFQAAQ